MRVAWLAAATALCFGASMASAQDVATRFYGFRVEGDFGRDRFQCEGTRHGKLGNGGTVSFDGKIGDGIIIGPEASYWRANKWSQNCEAARDSA